MQIFELHLGALLAYWFAIRAAGKPKPDPVGNNMDFRMRKTLTIFAAMLLFAFTANAQTKKNGTPDMRYRANKQTYGNSYSAPAPSPSSGPYYGGGTHTERHGGTYQGAMGGSSHKGGTYINPNTNSHYGRHKRIY